MACHGSVSWSLGLTPTHRCKGSTRLRHESRSSSAQWSTGTFTNLRRTFATHLRSLGVERVVVSKLLNHAEAGVTKIYDRYAADPEKTAAMERWANRLREIISGAPANNVVQMTPKSA